MGTEIIRIAQEALLLTVIISAPPILAALIVGLMVAVFQALTQIQEQTLSMTLKIIAVFGTLLLTGYWLGSKIYQFAYQLFMNFAQWGNLG